MKFATLTTLALTAIILIITCNVVGRVDWLSLVLGLFIIYLLFIGIAEVQHHSRKALSVAARRKTRLHQYLGREKSTFTSFLAIVSSIVLATGFIIILKGIFINHGFAMPIIALMALSLAHIYWTSTTETDAPNRNKGSQLEPPVHLYATNIITVVVASLVLNLLLAISLSAKDTYTFLTSSVNFSNFELYALDRSVSENGTNSISRLLINLYLLMDAFKVALSNQFVLSLMGIEESERQEYYHAFSGFVFLLNYVKLLPFSIGYIFLLNSIRKLVILNYDRAEPKVTRAVQFLTRYTSKSYEKLKQRFQKNTSIDLAHKDAEKMMNAEHEQRES